MAGINLIGQRVQGYKIEKKLGSGGFGTVYLGIKEEMGKRYQTAIKYIAMPDAEGYEAALQDYSYDKAATQEYFEKMVAEITSEINMLMELSKKDNRYIVAYYDHEIQRHTDPLYYEIFMRMEYLTPLNHHIRRNGMTVGEVIQLGINMCDALMLCHSSGVMHRDIKEANIFISENRNFKLGDFGVAKSAVETSRFGSVKGTASYMAPEIYRREPYDKSVDIYSLGIVLYKLLNNQRTPFMPDAPAAFTADDKNAAEDRRLNGETPPLPANAKNRLGEIIVKACSAKSERYIRAEELKKELQGFLQTLGAAEYDQPVLSPVAGEEDTILLYEDAFVTSRTQTQGAMGTMGAQRGAQRGPQKGPQPSLMPVGLNPYAEKEKPKKEKKPKGKKKRAALAVVVGVVLIAFGITAVFFFSKLMDPVSKFQEAVSGNDFIKAAQLYQDKLRSGSGDQLAEAAAFALDYAKEAKESYIRGEAEYEAVLSQLQEMGKIGILSKDELDPIMEELNEMRVSRAAYENAQSEIKAGNYKDAIDNLHKVIQADLKYTEAQKELATAIKGYKDALFASLSVFHADKQYKEAIAALKEGLLVVPDDADIQAKIADYEKKIRDELSLAIDEIIRDAKSGAYESSDYASALTDLRAAQKQYPNREEIKDAIREMEESYVAKELGEAEKLANESRYEEAVNLLGEALKLTPDQNSIKEAIKNYKAKYPMLLQQMVYFTGSNLTNDGQEMDNLQNMQTNIVAVDDYYGNFDNSYKLNGKYKRMTGCLYQPFEERSSRYKKVLAIYGDGRLLFSSEMGAGIEPANFDLDLAGVELLEIKLNDEGQANLANVLLYQ